LSSTSHANEDRIVVAPTVWFLKAVAQDPPDFLRPGIVDRYGFAGTIRFARPLQVGEVAELELMGVHFSARFKRAHAWEVDHIGTVYPAWISWSALDGLLQFDLAVQIEPEYVIQPVVPLNVTKPLTGVPELTQHLHQQLGLKAGEGVKLADIDSGIDVFHPSFFHADGGYYAWLDNNGDGSLTFGVDTCDLNGDGAGSPDEILQYHDVSLVNAYNVTSMEFLDPDGIFELDIDWVYADENGNGERDFGRDAGFYDDAPAFGEPILLIDDVDGNGKLDLTEKLVMLRTSKVKKALVLGKEYLEGENLTELTSSVIPPSSSGAPTSMHGTGVAGILAANTPGFNRFVGMAPYIDLYMIDSTSEGYFQPGGVDGMLPKLLWARDEDVDILLFEVASYGLTFMDGTSNLEKAMDQLYETNGILQVVPAGNLAASGKHLYTQLPPGESQLGIKVPDMHPDIDFYPFKTPVYIFSLYWPGDEDDVELQIALPKSGSWKQVPQVTYEPISLGSYMIVYSFASKSISGFTHRMCYVIDQQQESVLDGKWQWKLKNNTGDKLSVHGFVSDPASDWNRTIEFDKWEAVDGTVCHPSTADSALSVAAYGGEFGPPEELGKIRDYSSRGPRMDGAQAIDLAAPDDPYTPLARMKTGLMMGNRDIMASYTVFGGTSGAGPHVAGALAILKQLNQGQSPKELFEAIVSGCVEEPQMGQLPNKEWGFGKLNIYNAQFGYLPQDNLLPAASVSVQRAGLTVKLNASQSSDPEGGPLEYRWDFDYDGNWDVNFMKYPELEYTYPAGGTITLKLGVRDEAGAGAHTLLTFDIEKGLVDSRPKAEPDPEVDVSTSDSSSHPIQIDEGDEPENGGGGGGCSLHSRSACDQSTLLLLALLLGILLVVLRKAAVRSS